MAEGKVARRRCRLLVHALGRAVERGLLSEMCPSADANAPQFAPTSPPVCPDFIGTFRLSLAGVAAFARLKIPVSSVQFAPCPLFFFHIFASDAVRPLSVRQVNAEYANVYPAFGAG